MKHKEVKSKKIIFFLLKIFLLICFGFLPSFLFVALFVQYGSPFSNYISFLSNLNESWIAWVAAFVIIFLSFIISKVARSPKDFKKIFHNKKRFVLILISLFIVVIMVAGQFYLYVNFLLGSDILISLSADRNNFFFDEDLEEVNFKMSVEMNPFCVAECEYEFVDLSSGKLIESGRFNIASILSKTQTYQLNKNDVSFGSQVLNSFQLTCRSKKTVLCFTSGKESKRNILITLNNKLSEEEEELLDDYREKIISLEKNFYISRNNFREYSANLENIEDYFFADYKTDINFSKAEDSLDRVEELWKDKNLESLSIEFSVADNEIAEMTNETSEFGENIADNIFTYNNLTEKINLSREILKNLSSGNFTEEFCISVNETINNFNEAILDFENEDSLEEKVLIINNIYSEIILLHNSDSGIPACSLGEINNKLFSKIDYIFLNQSVPVITLNSPSPYCCYFGDCDKCCEDSCSNKNYPVIFLHGHSINGALPADYSLNTFTEIKNNLISDGLVDAGTFSIGDEEDRGIWGVVDVQMMITASYFFDVYKTAEGENTMVASNTEGIDTYAIRLRNIVKTMKERTGKDKVIIVAHSMGGLVTRRYLQIFGDGDVDKIILVSVPNHGITDKIKDYCAVFGSETACNDMKEESILVNQVNNAKSFNDTYNIIGIGCDMGDGTGDGIVKNSSQYLNYAKNYYVDGTCNELNFNFLHETILYPDLHQETYEIIKKILIGDNQKL